MNTAAWFREVAAEFRRQEPALNIPKGLENNRDAALAWFVTRALVGELVDGTDEMVENLDRERAVVVTR